MDWEAKQVAPDPGLARVYVYRRGAVLLGTYGSFIAVDDRTIGTIYKGRYVFRDVTPGRRRLSAATIEHNSGRAAASAELYLDVEADRVYFVRVEVAEFWPTDPPTISLVPEFEGIAALGDCWLAE